MSSTEADELLRKLEEHARRQQPRQDAREISREINKTWQMLYDNELSADEWSKRLMRLMEELTNQIPSVS